MIDTSVVDILSIITTITTIIISLSYYFLVLILVGIVSTKIFKLEWLSIFPIFLALFPFGQYLAILLMFLIFIFKHGDKYINIKSN